MTDSLGLDEEETSGRMKVTQLEELIPEIKWGDMLRATLDQFDLDLDVDSLIVTLHCNKYVPELVELLQDTPKRVIVNYMLWRFVLRYMPYISNYFEQLWQQFRSETSDISKDVAFLYLWNINISTATGTYSFIKILVQVNIDQDTRVFGEIDAMVEEVREAFRMVIDRQDWLQPEMKELCSDKLDIMGKKIGYPEYIESIELLDAEFEELDILEDHFLNNIIRMKKHEVWKELKKLSRPVDKNRDWLIQPLVVNAFHNPTANEIIL
ncbi:unnamed protein product, partial [Meganyctiphanes norvegica]